MRTHLRTLSPLLLLLAVACGKKVAAPVQVNGYPDMQVKATSLGVASGPYHAGDQITPSSGYVEITNVGQAVADTVIVQWALSVNTTFTVDDFIAWSDTLTNWPPGNGAGGAIWLSPTPTPRVPIPMTAGTYYFGIFAVVRGSRPEANLGNNAAMAAGSVIVN